MNNRKIVITGLGVIAPNGTGKEEFWQAMKEGSSGIKPIKRFDTSDFQCKLGGEIDDFEPKRFLGTKGLRELDRSARLLCSAAAVKSAISFPTPTWSWQTGPGFPVPRESRPAPMMP